jgi:hypothetical protein
MSKEKPTPFVAFAYFVFYILFVGQSRQERGIAMPYDRFGGRNNE